MTCWQQAFLQTCGNDNQVAYYACQTIRAYTSAAYGECDDRCMSNKQFNKKVIFLNINPF